MIRQYVHQRSRHGHHEADTYDKFFVFEDRQGDKLRCIIEAPIAFASAKQGRRWFKSEFRGKTEFVS